MRNAIIEILGILIKELSITEDGDPIQTQRQVEKDSSISCSPRFLDLNSYVQE